MQFTVSRDWRELPVDAGSLFGWAEKNSLFCSRFWFECLAEHALSDNQQLLLASVHDDRELLALLPLVVEDGQHCRALSHRYTSLYAPLIRSADVTAVLECLVHGLRQLPYRAFELAPVDPQDATTAQLQQAFIGNDFACHHGFRFYNWVCHVEGQSFAGYMRARPARLRNTIARKQRKLAREHDYRIQLYSGAAVPDAMADYHACYNASWKAREQYNDLLDAVVAAFSAAGWTRLAVLYVAGRPIAAQLWFVAHGTASIFRLAYDARWKAWSPGSILTAYLMAHVIDTDRVGEIDFLNGNEAYKQDWMSTRRERWALVFEQPARPASASRGFLRRLFGRSK